MLNVYTSMYLLTLLLTLCGLTSQKTNQGCLGLSGSNQLNEHLWTQVLKHLNVHIYLFTSVYQVLQSTRFAY